jgi:dipeptidyl-peptidase-4
MNQLMWMGESTNFSYVENNELIKGTPSTKDRNTLVNLDDLNAGLTDLSIDSIKRFPEIHYLTANQFWFTYKDQLFSFDITSKNLERLGSYPEKAENVDIDDKTMAIAYTNENNLFIALADKQIQITNDENNGIVNGQTVHRVEFGIHTGTFWSPDGKSLAFYRMDETMVADYPLVNIDPEIAVVENTKYPMAGQTSHYVTLGVFNMETQQTVSMKTGEPKDQYLASVTWDPSGESIYIALLNRDQNHLKLNKYNAKTGELMKTLFEEKSEKYVEPQNPLFFEDALPGHFIWMSERDGFNHLYLYNTDGELVKQLTSGDWVVTNYLGMDKKGKTIFISTTMESPIEQNIYALDIRSDKMSRISPEHGTHTGSPSKSGDYVIDSYSSTEMAREYKILTKTGNIAQVLLTDKDPLADYQLGEMSIFTLKADDGSDLYCRLIKPSNFEEGKKYPVFFYVYGGPHSQLVNDSWLGAAGIHQNFMAQQGYAVFTMDNRGTAQRGRDFEQAIFRNLGVLELADQMKGVEYLKSLDFVDADRMGIDGWSYGGFLTVSMMLKQPGVFKAACAGGPVIDSKYYEVMYGERYMDTPETNPEGYENAALTNYVDQLQGDLLILQGTMDPTVVWQNSLSFIKKCVDEGKQVEYFVYPGHGHNVRGKDRVHMYEKIQLFFDEKLKSR